ncbi:MAG: ATP-binding protein [Candidatus Obscuribacterales bacterium]|nr:ATP-binding protein [Candidatus Obscuribacterales bacterium]
MDHVGYLYHLSKTESEERYNRRADRLIRQAKLPRGKTLDAFDLARFEGISESQVSELAEGTCLDSAENILIFGNPGTGKSHLAAAARMVFAWSANFLHHSQCPGPRVVMRQARSQTKSNAEET